MKLEKKDILLLLARKRDDVSLLLFATLFWAPFLWAAVTTYGDGGELQLHEHRTEQKKQNPLARLLQFSRQGFSIHWRERRSSQRLIQNWIKSPFPAIFFAGAGKMPFWRYLDFFLLDSRVRHSFPTPPPPFSLDVCWRAEIPGMLLTTTSHTQSELK